MHGYKFQALIRLCPVPGDVVTGASAPAQARGSLAESLPPGQMRRMVVKAEHHSTRGTRFFSALVTNRGDSAEWLDDIHSIVTVQLSVDEPAEYFNAGDHFAIWSGRDVAVGVVTRRLFV